MLVHAVPGGARGGVGAAADLDVGLGDEGDRLGLAGGEHDVARALGPGEEGAAGGGHGGLAHGVLHHEGAAAVAEPRGHGERQVGGGEPGGHVERVADRLGLARREGLGGDLGAEPGHLVLLEHVAALVDDEGAQHVGVLIGGVAVVAEAGRGEPAAVRVGDLDLDPGVLDVEHAAGEAVADEQVADHDVEIEARAGRDRGEGGAGRAVGGQEPARVAVVGLADPRPGDIDRGRALELGLQPPQVLAVATHGGHPGVAAEEAMRGDRAGLGAGFAGRRRLALHVAVDAGLLVDLVDAAGAVAGPGGVAPHAGLVEPRQVHRHVHVRRQEAAVAADAQLGAEPRDGGLRLVARDRRGIAEAGRLDRRARPDIAAVAVLGRALDAVAQPAGHAGVGAQIGGRDGVGGGHEAVDHERHVVAAAAVLARRLAEQGALLLDVDAVDRVAERGERVRAGRPLRRGVGVAGRAAVDVGQHAAVADVRRIVGHGPIDPTRGPAPRRLAALVDRDQARRVLAGHARQPRRDRRRDRRGLGARAALAAARGRGERDSHDADQRAHA